jgi:hypothetical protein
MGAQALLKSLTEKAPGKQRQTILSGPVIAK